VIEVGRAGFGTLCGIDGIALHDFGAVGEGVSDGGREQRPRHAGPALPGGGHEAGNGPHVVPAGIPHHLRACRCQDFRTQDPGIAAAGLDRAPAHGIPAAEGQHPRCRGAVVELFP
jgi:hypothetical protein